ncbi:MAG: metal-dependent hydrolase [Methanosphaera sp.]|nr:metal-dependent hydrolase [Methanosphaera sp.]
MSSYREHAIVGLIFALPFVPSIFYLFFALIGASIPDMDHKNNTNKVYSMLITGIIVAILSILLGGSTILTLIIIALAMIFYFSKHRGFTHTFMGSIILSFLFMLMFIALISVLSSILSFVGLTSTTLVIFISLVVMGYFTVSRRYLLLYVGVLTVYLLFMPVSYTELDWVMIILSLLLGLFSHIVLDLWTPAGIALFKPFTNKKFHRKSAIILICIWIILVFMVIFTNNSLFTIFTPIFK